MRIKKLEGWPPSTFQAAEARGLYAPASASRLELQVASLIPSVTPKESPEVFLLWKDPDTERLCSVRFKMGDAGAAIRLAKALAACRGKALGEIGEVEIREETDTFPGLRGLIKK